MARQNGMYVQVIQHPPSAHGAEIVSQRYWSKLEGDGTVLWADAHLTDIGIEQAKAVNHFWSLQTKTQKIAMPQKYYTSPLHRCLATANLTFAGLETKSDQPFTPMVKEVGLPRAERIP